MEISPSDLRGLAQQASAQHVLVIEGSSLIARHFLFWIACFGSSTSVLQPGVDRGAAESSVLGALADVARAWGIPNPLDRPRLAERIVDIDVSGRFLADSFAHWRASLGANVDEVWCFLDETWPESADDLIAALRQRMPNARVTRVLTVHEKRADNAVPLEPSIREVHVPIVLRHPRGSRAGEKCVLSGIAERVAFQPAPITALATQISPSKLGTSLDVVPIEGLTRDLLTILAGRGPNASVIRCSASAGVRLEAVAALIAKTAPGADRHSQTSSPTADFNRELESWYSIVKPYVLPPGVAKRTMPGQSFVLERNLELALAPTSGSEPGGDRVPVIAPDGCRLSVTRWGSGTSPKIVIVNAVGMSHELVSPLARELSAAHCVLVCESRHVPALFELRNESELDFQTQVDDVAEVIRHFGEERVYLMGWCTGAQIALEVASMFPESIEALALVCGSFSYESALLSDWQRRLREILARVAPRRALCERFVDMVYGVEAPGRAPDSGASAYAALTSTRSPNIGYETSTPFRTTETLYRYARIALDSFGRRDRVQWRKLTSRVLIMSGTDDDVVNPAAARRVCEDLPSARLIEVRGAGHYLPYQQAKMTAGLLGSFFCADAAATWNTEAAWRLESNA